MAAATGGDRNEATPPSPSVLRLAKSIANSESGLKKVRFDTSERGSMAHVNNKADRMVKTLKEKARSSSDKKDSRTAIPNSEKTQRQQIDTKAEEEEVYEVEAILSHRKRTRCKEIEFLLKWKGYPESENSWEPKSNLSCNELLNQYMIKHQLITKANLAISEMSSSVEQPEKTGQIEVKQRRPKRSEAYSDDAKRAKLPRNKPAASNLSNTKGDSGTKKVKDKIIKKSTQKISLPNNRIKELQTGSESNCIVTPKHDIRTMAQVTPANPLTSLARKEDPHLHVAALGVDKPTVSGSTNIAVGDKDDDDDDVVILHVDPPRYRLQPQNPVILPNICSLSPTETYFSSISRCRTLQCSAPSVPTVLPASPDFALREGLQHTESLTVNSQCSSPLVSSPFSDKSFNLHLSSSSSTDESESPDKTSIGEACQMSSPAQSPIASYAGVSNGLLPNSKYRSRTKRHPSRYKNKPVLKKKPKQHLNQHLNGTNSKLSFKRFDLSNRRGRMGPVPRPCQPVHHQSVSTSLQTKAAKDSNSSSAPHVNGTSNVQSHPIETNHFTKDEHISVIFKFNGVCKQVLVRKRNLFAGGDDSDTDADISTTEKGRPLFPAKRHKTMKPLASSNESNTTYSVNGVMPNQVITNGVHKNNVSSSPSADKARESSKCGFSNGLGLVCVDSSAGSSGSFSNPLHFQPLQMMPPNGVSPESIYCDSVSSLASIESVRYKQILLDWQFQLNRQRGGTDDIIFVENEIDRAEPPRSFTYICSSIYGDGVPDPNLPGVRDSLCGCQCYHLGKRCGPKAPYCCSTMADVPFAYTLAGKVCVTPGTPIYECNWKCSCPVDCVNRVVQHGRKIPLCIFRTNNSRGWGVKTLQSIKANTFVTEYVGEVITSEEAERRGKHYDEEGETYLFDLDFDDDHMFTIDAKNYGNISHFFNHACDPNLVVYSVWIDTLDKRLPRIAFFTTKNVSAGEELTFDYQMNLDQGRSTSRRKIACRCGSQNCLQYIN